MRNFSRAESAEWLAGSSAVSTMNGGGRFDLVPSSTMSGLSAHLPAPRHDEPSDSQPGSTSGPTPSTALTRSSSSGGALVHGGPARLLPAQGNALPVPIGADGKVQYDAVVKQGLKPGQEMQTSRMDVVPLRQRPGARSGGPVERPSGEEIQATADRTRAALEKITQNKVKGAQPKTVSKPSSGPQYIRYTPANQRGGLGTQRIIQMVEVAEDPLEPSRKKQVKTPARPPSPPPPVLRSPPRKATAAELKEWDIPPVISNWKNNRGFTIPLDKRLAADGRGLQDVSVSEEFAHFSEALNAADHLAREEVRQRSAMQAKLAEKEKAAKEEHLRLLAQRAREACAAEDNSGGRRIDGRPDAMGVLAGYGSESGSDTGSASGPGDESEDSEAAERDRVRAERRREKEREMRLSKMGTEQRARLMAKEQNRDISEKIALGMAKPSTQGGLDERLFNRESLKASWGDDDSYALYDQPLLQGSSAARAIYSRPAQGASASDSYGGGTVEGISDELTHDRFGLGASKFQGASEAASEAGPVMFEKDSDPFAIGQFLDDAKRGTKRAGDEDGIAAPKRARQDE